MIRARRRTSRYWVEVHFRIPRALVPAVVSEMERRGHPSIADFLRSLLRAASEKR